MGVGRSASASEARFSSDLWLLTHPDLRSVARIKAVADFLFAELQSDPRLAAADGPIEPR